MTRPDITRRTLLVTAGASVALVGTGLATQRITRGIEPARAPWRTAADGFADVRLDALSHAVLAPNPHNKQPWLVELVGDDRLILHADPKRLLPETDPFDRQIVVGLGAFLELLRQASAERGHRAVVDPWPEGPPEPRLDSRCVAHVRLLPDPEVARDPLFAHVYDRRTVRTPFENRPVAAAAMEGLRTAAGGRFAWTADPAAMGEIGRLANEGWIIETATARTHRESTHVLRIGADEVIANPDGIALHGPTMEALHLGGILTHDAYDTPGTRAFEASRTFYRDAIGSAAAFGWLASPDNTRVSQLAAGRDWVRLHLAATGAGLALQPLSQVLQEFPEMADLYDAFHRAVGVDSPARVQGLFRLGHAPYPEPAPRWSVETRIVEA